MATEEQEVTETEASQEGAFESGDSGEVPETDAFAAGDDAEASDTGAEDGEPSASAEAEDPSGSEQEGQDQEAPETYDIKLPEGIELSEERHDMFLTEAGNMKLSNDQAQRVVDLYVKLQAEDVDRSMGVWRDLRQSWAQASKAAGLLKPEVRNMAKSGLQAVDNDGSLGKTLSDLGLDHHPAILEVFRAYGQSVSSPSDVPTAGSGDTRRETSRREILYPDLARSA
tara:strand:+ start:5617 stop:6297 length:681 start_codon:yes stop_codon:yes gene_type:complete